MVFCWDFNCVLGSHEKRGGGPPHQLACDEFAAFTNATNPIHMHTQGDEFTWSNGRECRRHTEVRLDRVIHNAAWIMIWSLSYCKL